MVARRSSRAAAGGAGGRGRSSGRVAPLLAAIVAVASLAAAADAASAAPTFTPLSGGGWALTNGNGTLSYKDLQVPVYPHQVLQSKGVIGDPLYRYNELETRWVSDETWTYAREFSASAAQAASPAADLVFKGLDTFASVSLNGDVILRADNFHRTWRVPVQGLLKAGKNTLSVTVEPAMATTLRLRKELPYTVNALHQPGGMDIYNYARKGAYSFGWGEFLGPCFLGGSLCSRRVGRSFSFLLSLSNNSSYRRLLRSAAHKTQTHRLGRLIPHQRHPRRGRPRHLRAAPPPGRPRHLADARRRAGRARRRHGARRRRKRRRRKRRRKRRTHLEARRRGRVRRPARRRQG
jgi:hypothetical protein